MISFFATVFVCIFTLSTAAPTQTLSTSSPSSDPTQPPLSIPFSSRGTSSCVTYNPTKGVTCDFASTGSLDCAVQQFGCSRDAVKDTVSYKLSTCDSLRKFLDVLEFWGELYTRASGPGEREVLSDPEDLVDRYIDTYFGLKEVENEYGGKHRWVTSTKSQITEYRSQCQWSYVSKLYKNWSGKKKARRTTCVTKDETCVANTIEIAREVYAEFLILSGRKSS